MYEKYRENLEREFRITAELIYNYCKMEDWDGAKKFLHELQGYLIAGYETELLNLEDYFEYYIIMDQMHKEYLDFKYGAIGD